MVLLSKQGLQFILRYFTGDETRKALATSPALCKTKKAKMLEKILVKFFSKCDSDGSNFTSAGTNGAPSSVFIKRRKCSIVFKNYRWRKLCLSMAANIKRHSEPNTL